MAGKIASCIPFRQQMPDAASASLSDSIFAAFNAHLRDCAGCRDEFRRVQTLLQAIDRTLSASLAAEPSPKLAASVRQSIAVQPHGAAAWRRWSAWATAAGACAVLAILLFVARTPRKPKPPLHDSATGQPSASSTSKLTTHPILHESIHAATLSPRPRKPAFRLARHTSPRPSNEITGEAEIIVEPGQMQAILQLVAATQTGKVNGADLFASQKNAAELFEIKPLVIDPLKISVLKDEREPSTSNGGLDSGKSSLSSRSN